MVLTTQWLPSHCPSHCRSRILTFQLAGTLFGALALDWLWRWHEPLGASNWPFNLITACSLKSCHVTLPRCER
ncbi:hypothetical protein B0I72DRAFT_140921 [Yarrowia lipolytica]|uniref:Uncharacterized protein n=1 Tax=Yarrowia lipolytica TaxID=4952 RepID=A0A371C745_YARLL|nr:hypothetical protein BKA91DRAFT_132370 [Yarrowia lipolytica]KAE8171803.1 hypothetical protein BKA90DRAFT_138496 [Yarrowia lipolytica]RDW26114.1 hypothetical protein B0I71DRAFT_131431 [Yarrowia lipolytica]RDW30808.1 hypothetical protein B0I72DRAFT_140921 [Yarrowia lipolytica]RDW38642.1 hypothetical protein B0I73DRAFT_133415 [Yarrowia lipolytica]